LMFKMRLSKKKWAHPKRADGYELLTA
jgi:hypothetical protein